MQKIIDSVTLHTSEDFIKIYNLLIDLYNTSKVQLFTFPNDFDVFAYFFVKSHRSSVTEGNTTSIGEFTQLVIENYNNNEDYVVPSKIFDETYEIVNLKKVYDFLQRNPSYSRVNLQRTHSIIGENIFKNNLLEQRGRLKTKNNHVPFIYKGKSYAKVFTPPNEVRQKIDKLFKKWTLLADDSPGAIFAKFLILQLEIISIHPFSDGNGRIARAFSESYLESKNFIPFTPYSLSHKKSYQLEMGKYSIISLDSIESAYISFATYVLESYDDNVLDLLEAVSRLSQAKDSNISKY